MSNWNTYKNKTYTQQESRKMDYELDLLHQLITDLYEINSCRPRIKIALERIERIITSKSDIRETT